jgi:hypothetical protein
MHVIVCVVTLVRQKYGVECRWRLRRGLSVVCVPVVLRHWFSLLVRHHVVKQGVNILISCHVTTWTVTSHQALLWFFFTLEQSSYRLSSRRVVERAWVRGWVIMWEARRHRPSSDKTDIALPRLLYTSPRTWSNCADLKSNPVLVVGFEILHQIFLVLKCDRLAV